MAVYRIYATVTKRYYVDIEAKDEDEALEAAEDFLDASDCEYDHTYGSTRFEWDSPEKVDEDPMFVVKDMEPVPVEEVKYK